MPTPYVHIAQTIHNCQLSLYNDTIVSNFCYKQKQNEATTLDDLRKIHERDQGDMLGAVAGQWRQLACESTFSSTLRFDHVRNVVCMTMGDSTAAALFVSVWPGPAVPFEVVRGFELPAYVGSNTLFIACNYSGNTEEAIGVTMRAVEAGAQVAVIAGEAGLAEMASERGYPLVLLPKVQYPQLTTLCILKALGTLLHQAVMCTTDDEELRAAADFLRIATDGWLPTVPTVQNLAKQIAQDCMGRSVVVYAGSKLSPAAYKWKVGINNNAKQVAWQGEPPESSYTEFSGWSKQPEQKPYAVVELRSNLEYPQVLKRFELAERLFSGLRPAPIIIDVNGDTVLQQLLWATVLGDFVSLYLALLNGLNPASSPLTDKLKRALES